MYIKSQRTNKRLRVGGPALHRSSLLPARLPSHTWPVSGGWRRPRPAPRARASGGPLTPMVRHPLQMCRVWAEPYRSSMVLKPSPCGEPCVAIDRRKGRSVPCGAEQAHVWYAGPTCKNCYLRSSNKARKIQKGGASEEGEHVSGGDILDEVIKVCGSRSVAPAPPSPFRSHISQLRASPAPFVRRSSSIPAALVDRSNPPDTDDEELEYDCYGWYRFESDAAGVRRLDRQWVALAVLAAADDWAEAVEAYDAKMTAARGEL